MELEELLQMISDLETKTEDLTSQIEEKNQKISQLSSNVSTLQNELQKKSEQIIKMKNAEQMLKAAEAKASWVSSMQEQITTQLVEIKSMQALNDAREKALDVRELDIKEREREVAKISKKRLNQKQKFLEEDREENREKWEIDLRRRVQAEAGREIRCVRMDFEQQYKRKILKWRLATGLLVASNVVAIIFIVIT